MPPSSARLCTALTSGLIGALVTVSLMREPPSARPRQEGHPIGQRLAAAPSPPTSLGWGSLRATACDGPEHGGVRVPIPANASIGRFAGRPVQLLRTIGTRDGLAGLANSLNLTGWAVELGVWRGEFAEKNLKVWSGSRYVLIDLWEPSDCVNGNRSSCVYGGNVSDGGVAERSFDKHITTLRMQRAHPRWRGRWDMVQASTLDAAQRYRDGQFDWLYLDATHTYAEARRDLEAWYPKVRVGGLISGHDYQFQHQTIGDGYTFGVRDAVDEFAVKRNTRVYSTMEPYLPSFYFLKCTVR